MKKENGVTLLVLVLVIIVMITLTTVGVYTGIDSYNLMKEQVFVAQMKVLREEINIIKEEYELWDEYNGNNIKDYIIDEYTIIDDSNVVTYTPIDLTAYPNSNEIKQKFISILTDKTNLKNEDLVLNNYLYFSSADLETAFGLSNLDINVIINFKTGTFVEKDGCDITNVFGRKTRVYVLDEAIALKELIDSEGGDIDDDEIKDLSIVDILLTENTADKTTISMILNKTTNLSKIEYAKVGTADWNEVSYSPDGSSIKIDFNKDKIGNFKFRVTEESTNYVIESTELEITKVNKPILLNDMKKVTWEANGDEIIAENDIEWYSYSSKDKKWANTKLPDDSLYVWIPRFAYKLDDNLIDIIFLEGTSNQGFDGSDLPTGYVVHPAFQAGTSTSYANGEYSKEISGIWVSKFENKITENTATGTGKTKYLLQSLPSVNISENPSLKFAEAIQYAREMEIDLASYGFKASSGTNLSMDSDYNFVEDYELLDTHLIKNSEWGAVTYLSYSKYGTKKANLKTTINTYTGGVNGFKKDLGLSSTGTIHGIYDLSNVTKEYVAAGTASYIKPIDSIQGTGTASSIPYLTIYNEEIANNAIVGDAMNEMNLYSFGDIKSKVYFDTSKGLLSRGGETLFEYNAIAQDEICAVRTVWIVFES